MEIQADELKIRIKLLETVFGAENLYSGDAKSNTAKVCKKTVEKWFAGKSMPTEKTLQKLCKAAGITVSECFAPFQKLPEILAEKQGHKLSQDQIRGELQRICGEKPESLPGKEGGIMSVLSEISSAISPVEMKKAFRILKGYYYTYMNWFYWEKTENANDPKISLYKFLIKIDEIDEKLNLIKVKSTTCYHLRKVKKGLYEETWGFQGVVVPVSGSLYFILEPLFEPLSYSGYMFIITRSKPISPLLGMVTVETRNIQSYQEPFQASTRIALMKISSEEADKGEDYLMQNIGFFEPYELKELSPELLENLSRNSESSIFR